MTKLRRYLVLDAQGKGRVTSRYPKVGSDEVAFTLWIQVPDGWGRLAGELSVTLPNAPVVEIR